ncbi:MAG: hypothetical protein EAZ85_14505 [Bacteroidetes bacterium]|nr:MAG: hypothetical protein EAZ85_14505 [Bacteroidota bacterium]TAG85640.1 MAG: hypothetical protein EAZ20_14595 [Bacteroidota bacterium]
MKYISFLFILILFTTHIFAQTNIFLTKEKINKENLIFASVSAGYANANMARYRVWGKQSFLQSVEASEDYLMFSGEFGGLNKGHLFQLEFAATAKTLTSIAPNLFQFSMRYGHIIHSYKRIDFIGSGGLGYCQYSIRFKGNPPPYLSSLPYNPSSAYAMQSSFLFTPEVAMFVRPKDQGFFFALRVGYHIDVARSVWKYGVDVRVRTSRGGTSSRFVGQEVSGIPSVMNQLLYTKLSFGYAF